MTRIIGHFVTGLARHVIAVVSQLHATKGWRPPFEARRRDFPEDGWHGNRRRDQIEGPLPMQRLLPRRIEERPIAVTAIMRHRERRRDAQRAANIAANKKEDQRLAGLR